MLLNTIVLLLGFIIIPLLFIVVRAIYLILRIYCNDCKLEHTGVSLRTLICIGSGGHTSEMLRIIEKLNLKKYQPRLYVMADSDLSSESKVLDLEGKETAYLLNKIPRSRNVGQSYTSSVSTTLHALFYAIPAVYNFKPDIILCNGPGTCVPICVIAFLLRCLYVLDCRIVFIESICRVRTMSLTGKLLHYIFDVIVVQWPQLRDVCPKGKYLGRLS